MALFPWARNVENINHSPILHKPRYILEQLNKKHDRMYGYDLGNLDFITLVVQPWKIDLLLAEVEEGALMHWKTTRPSINDPMGIEGTTAW